MDVVRANHWVPEIRSTSAEPRGANTSGGACGVCFVCTCESEAIANNNMGMDQYLLIPFLVG